MSSPQRQRKLLASLLAVDIWELSLVIYLGLLRCRWSSLEIRASTLPKPFGL